MPDVANLLAGTPVVYIGPEDESLPELNDLAPPTITVTPAGNWSRVGFTMEDLEFPVTQETEGVVVNEHQAAVEPIITSEAAIMRFTLAENDLQAFSEALNASTLTTVAAAGDQTGQDQLGFGDGSKSIKSLLILGTNPEGGSRVIHVYRAKQTNEVTFTFSKSHRGYQVEFTCYADPDQSAGERLFKIYDITAQATS